jgi:hypothetical protein
MPWIFWNPRKPTNAAAITASVVDPIIRLLARVFIKNPAAMCLIEWSSALRHRLIVRAKQNQRKAACGALLLPEWGQPATTERM